MDAVNEQIQINELQASANLDTNTVLIRRKGHPEVLDESLAVQRLSSLSQDELSRHCLQYIEIYISKINGPTAKQIAEQFQLDATVIIADIEELAEPYSRNRSEDYTIFSIAKLHMRHLASLRCAETLPIPFIAWNSRNIFELFLWLSFVTTSRRNAKDFAGHILFDSQQILKGFTQYVPDSNDPLLVKQLAAQLKRHEQCAADFGTIIPKATVRVNHLASLAHERLKLSEPDYHVLRDMDCFYKLSSKFVHPSPHIIGGNTDDRTELIYKHVMLMKAVEYSNLMLKLYKQGIDASEVKTSTGSNDYQIVQEAWAALADGRLGQFGNLAASWRKRHPKDNSPFLPVEEFAQRWINDQRSDS